MILTLARLIYSANFLFPNERKFSAASLAMAALSASSAEIIALHNQCNYRTYDDKGER